MDICRTRFARDIITEFVPPRNRKSRKVMIFCAGIPSIPCKDDVLEFWARKGYWTFFPRYRGTWESEGVFLQKSLDQDLLDVINDLPNKFRDYMHGESFSLSPRSIIVVGSSFGGPAALLASRDPRVTKAICISPVVDWKEENKSEPLDKFYHFLKHAYGGAYRLNKTKWNQLARGTLYNPVNHVHEIDGRKVMIFHAQDDDVVKYKPVAKFAAAIDGSLILLKRGGHLSSSMLMEKKYYPLVKKFLS